MLRCVAVCLAIVVTAGYPVSESENQQKSMKQHILEDIRAELREYYNAMSKPEESGSGGRRNEDEFDSKDIDPDDENMQLFLSMGVEINGVVKKPKGLHPENSKLLKEQSLDRTIQTDRDADKEGQRRNKRNFGPGWVRWPKGIVPYILDDNLVANRRSFLEAVDLFNNLTCIRWKSRSPEVKAEAGHDGYVKIQSGSGCSSSGLGFKGDRRHNITLQEPGCGSVDIAVHEMLHILGQTHEQSRNDRNRYVKIIWKNVISGHEENFYRVLTYDRNPYDLGSIMQYETMFFGVDDQGTMELRDKNLEFLAYPDGELLSFYDLKDVLDQYGCTDHCTNTPKCQNAGYVNTNCECECPKGFTGALCETVVTDPDCGGYVTLEDDTFNFGVSRDKSVSSPNYPDPVGLGKICRWAVKAPSGYIIKMTIDDLHMAHSWNSYLCYHWLEIQYNLPGQPGIRRCGDIVGKSFLTSVDSPTFMIVTMDTKRAGKMAANKGLKLHFKLEREDAIAPEDCIEFGKEKEYNGTRSYTKKGIKCQAWNASEPHLVASKYAHFESNYCRMGDAADPWCYTTDANKTWDWCGVPYCYATECSYASDGSDYVGTVSHTVNGLPCQMWESNTPHKHRYNMLTQDQNYCRNPDSSVAPWCMTMDPAVRLGYCDVPRCERVEQECILTATGIDYAGKTNVTASGTNCLPWKNISEKMAHEGNYCRNPDSSKSPWCYVQGNTKHVKEKCTIPSCAESPCFQNPCKNHGKCTVNDTSFTCTCLNGFKGDHCEILESIEEADCKRTTTGWEYSGKIGITKSGRTCQAWGSQTPHGHTYGTNLPGNYCRDPSDSGYLWCYTTDPYKEWEECNIPNCATPPLECIPDSDLQGKLYFGTYNVTQFGYPCQRWDSQTPHEHSQSALSDQENYCRNPDNKAMPWCYTTNPNRAWLFCIIRDC